MRDVSTLDVPPSRAGARALQATRTTAGGGHVKRTVNTFQGLVLSAPNNAGRVKVAIGGESKTAHLAPTAKAVNNGDTVIVYKFGGKWMVQENQTWHEPPKAGPAPSTSTPQTAQTVSTIGVDQYNMKSLPAPSGSSNNQLFAHAERTSDRYFTMRAQVLELVSAMRAIESAYRSVINNNAGRQNQTRDLATSVRDTVGPLREGAIQDRVIR